MNENIGSNRTQVPSEAARVLLLEERSLPLLGVQAVMKHLPSHFLGHLDVRAPGHQLPWKSSKTHAYIATTRPAGVSFNKPWMTVDAPSCCTKLDKSATLPIHLPRQFRPPSIHARSFCLVRSGPHV